MTIVLSGKGNQSYIDRIRGNKVSLTPSQVNAFYSVLHMFILFVHLLLFGLSWL